MRRLSIGIVLFWVLGCSGVEEADTGNGGGSGAACPDPGTPACDVFDLVNDERRSRNLSPYGWSGSLAEAARLHAVDMVEHDYFDHRSLDGRSFSDRALDAGYTGFPSGENIAAGQRSAEEVMESWMNSEGHRNNILSRSSNELGVGVHERHWVQVFGQR